MNNLDALFNPTVVIEDKKRVIEDYKPSAEKGKGGVYKSIVRFVPWYKNPANSLLQKWSCWLVDPLTGKGKTIDCPSSIGEPSLIRDTFFQLRNSKSVAHQEQAKVFSSRQTFCTLVQVIKDENAPELEGRILRFTFGKKIYEKITSAMKPEFGDPINPFDIFAGAPFAFIISKKNEFNNYDQCKFMNQSIPLQWVDETTGKLTPMSQTDDKAKIAEFLKENSADLDKYAYRPWDDEQKAHVNNVISAVTGKTMSSSVTADVINDNSNHVFSGSEITETVISTTPTTGFASDSIDLDALSSDSSFADIEQMLESTDGDLPF